MAKEQPNEDPNSDSLDDSQSESQQDANDYETISGEPLPENPDRTSTGNTTLLPMGDDSDLSGEPSDDEIAKTIGDE